MGVKASVMVKESGEKRDEREQASVRKKRQGRVGVGGFVGEKAGQGSEVD